MFQIYQNKPLFYSALVPSPSHQTSVIPTPINTLFFRPYVASANNPAHWCQHMSTKFSPMLPLVTLVTDVTTVPPCSSLLPMSSLSPLPSMSPCNRCKTHVTENILSHKNVINLLVKVREEDFMQSQLEEWDVHCTGWCTSSKYLVGISVNLSPPHNSAKFLRGKFWSHIFTPFCTFSITLLQSW